MKIKSLAWLKAASVASLLALTLTACGAAGTSSSSNSTEALGGSDQVSTDKYTTADVTPLDKIDKSKLGLGTEGVLRIGTLSDAPPNIFLKDGVFTGFDNELLRAIASKLGLKTEFVSTDFAALLSQVQNKQFDVGSSSISTTDKRRKNVGFTNGYDFGYMAVVTKSSSAIKGFKDLKGDIRIGVVQGTVQDDYVTNTLGIEPVRFPDYNTVFANVKNGQVDAWVAPSQQATGQVKPGDGTTIAESVINTQNFTAYAVNSENKALIDALNSGLDAVVADGTWAKLAKQWYPDRETPKNWKPGSKASKLG
ncbi:substrate-binding periplasmic protein [Psychromicrobium lacuslunae]|uniref:Amino acid ABC transporter n=1 Tax=Psychromicrobium lacuslunae TaxID=1618207 RepID=A0A0D4BZG8_9MICC|nr:ABC transporter substrate-binding protein [Psychromicrobium lacuslunae]AJT41525.1 amino acid ABC transporter [Psychromicrobium lacuslunae]